MTSSSDRAPRPPVAIADVLHPTRFTRFHLVLLAAAVLVELTEGFEMQLIGYTAPAMIKSFGVSQLVFSWFFTANNLGFMVGAFAFGTLGDRVGRKRMVLAGVLLFGLFTFAIAAAPSFGAVAVFRGLSGVGLGGALPNLVAIVSEYAPRQRRGTALSALFVAYTFGSAASGLLASVVLRGHSWTAMFLIGGLAATVAWLAVLLAIPESAHFLSRRMRTEELRRITRRIDPHLPPDAFVALHDASGGSLDASVGPPEAFAAPRKPRSPLGRLFADGLGAITVPLWVAFLSGMISLHLLTSWLPTLINGFGVETATAVLLASGFHGGATVANLLIGRQMDRWGAVAVAVLLFFAVPAVVLLGLARWPVALLAVLIGATGFGVAGGMNGVVGLSGTLYPEAVRATGSGWMYGVGRIGSIAGPVLGGLLLTYRLPTLVIFPAIAVPVLVAACAVLVISRTSKQPSVSP